MSDLALDLAPVDQAIVVGYLALTFAIGLWMARGTQSGEDLFLAGRRLPWWAIGLSLFASNISSTTLIGLMGAAYTAGISVANYEWMAAVVLGGFVLFLAPRLYASRITTMPELLGRRFDGRVAQYVSGLTLLMNVFVDTAGSLYAGALVLQLFFPSLDFLLLTAGLALFAGIYTAFGGLAAVVYTDALQAVVLLAGSTLVAWALFGSLDFSWAAVSDALPPERLSLIRPLSDPQLPWLGTLIGVPVLGFYFWCTNQFITQRLLAARSLDHARWGALFGGFLKLPVLFIMVLPGAIAAVAIPGIERGDQVFPTVLAQHLPVGLLGLVVASLIAAIMSSVDSTLNSAATLFTVDFVLPRRPNLSERQLARIGRVSILILMVVSAVWAPQIRNFQGLFAYLQQVLSYLVPPLAAVFIAAFAGWPVRASGALGVLLGAHGLSLAWVIALGLGLVPAIHFTLVAGVLFFLSLGGLLIAGRLMPADKQPLPWEAAPVPPEASGWRSHRVWTLALLLTTAALVLAFW